MASAKLPLVSFDRVAFDYGGNPILHDVSLNLMPGSFHFLTGPSGAGKTTLMRLVSCALRPKRGRLQVFGQDVEELSRDEVAFLRRRMGIVHQDCKFLDHLSLRENVALPLQIVGQPSNQDLQNVEELIAWVGLEHRAEAAPAELSSGEQQRAALARALIMTPELVLADEPTGNVDHEMADRLIGLLCTLNKMGQTIIVATHDLALIRATKNRIEARVLRLSEGQLTIAGAHL